MTTFINYTPHVIDVCNTDNLVYDQVARCYRLPEGEQLNVIRTFPSSGVARCTTNQSVVFEAEDPNGNFPVFETTYGEIDNLPNPVPGTIYIVSAIVALAGRQAGRTDLAIPTNMVKTEDGRTVLGCTGFSIR